MTTEFNPGDKIRVIKEVTVKTMFSDSSCLSKEGGFISWAQDYASVELIEPADDPSKDPVGTVRQCDTIDPIVAVKVRLNEWRVIQSTDESSTTYTDKDVRRCEWEVIDVVPGTPTANADTPQKKDAIDQMKEEEE